LNKNTSSMVITQPNIIRPERNSNLKCNSSRYSRIPNIKSIYYIDLIFGMRLYVDELQFKFEFRSGRMIFSWVMTIELVFLFNKNTSSRVITQPKVIRPEPNSNLNCNSSRYSHIPNIKSNILKHIKKKSGKLKIWTKIQVQWS
jgi:hypothetical protein